MILLFVGAGGSAAVDPDQYPVTLKFFADLPHDIRQNFLVNAVCTFLYQTKEKTPADIDIEDMLEVLDELQADLQKMGNINTITGWAMNTNGGIFLESQQQFRRVQRLIDKVSVNNLEPLRNRIKEKIHHFYGTRPDPEKLAVWESFLNGLLIRDPILEVFTTNYDLVLEETIKKANIPIDHGFVQREDYGPTVLEVGFWQENGKEWRLPDDGLLTKLHGSMDWLRTDEEIIVASSDFFGNPQRHCVLYPGYKGTPTKEPFRSFHNHLRQVVREKPTGAVFVGYAFRDGYINRILANLPKATPAFFISLEKDPTNFHPPKGAPVTDRMGYFLAGLTEEAAVKCCRFLEPV